MLKSCEISMAHEKFANLEWLSPLKPRERQAAGIGQVTGAGDWLLLTSEFAR